MNWLYSVLIFIGVFVVIRKAEEYIIKIDQERLKNIISRSLFVCLIVLGVHLIHTILVSCN